MSERRLCEMHGNLSQFLEEWGDVHIIILKFITAAVTYCDFSRSTGLTAEFELLFSSTKRVFFLCERGQ